MNSNENDTVEWPDALEKSDAVACPVERIVSAYSGMSDRESVTHQVKHWAAGTPTHNPIRDECCPDFSCCQPSLLMDEPARKRFLEAHLSGDDETRHNMLMMCLGGMLSEAGADEKVHLVGEDHTEH